MIQTKKQKQPKNQTTPRNAAEPTQLTFLEHVYEVRRRVFWIVATLIVASAIGFQFKDLLVDVIMAPLNGEKLVYLTPGGGFSFIFTLCIYFGVLISIPVILYHAYRFLQPLLKGASRRFMVILIMLSSVLAIAGASFGYFIAIPAAINFLTTFAGDAVTPNLTADSYLGFVVAYMLGLAALFQLPLLLFMFDHIRRIPPGKLLSTQRYVIIGAVVAAAIITPTPDVVNQMIVAGPIIAVYQLGAIAVFVRRKIRSRTKQTPVNATIDTVPVPVPVTEQIPDTEEPVEETFARVREVVIRPSSSKPRSIDGFISPRAMSVQVSKNPDERINTSRELPRSRQMRSIDGFLPA